MLQWEEVPNATWPWERYRAVGAMHEYRIFHDPEERHGGGLASILGVREVPEGLVPRHVKYYPYHTDAEAKKAADQWEGPPPAGG